MKNTLFRAISIVLALCLASEPSVSGFTISKTSSREMGAPIFPNTIFFSEQAFMPRLLSPLHQILLSARKGDGLFGFWKSLHSSERGSIRDTPPGNILEEKSPPGDAPIDRLFLKSPELQPVYEYAKATYKDPAVFDYCRASASNLVQLYRAMGKKPPNDILALALLQKSSLQGTEKIRRFPKHLLEGSDNSLLRTVAAGRIPYQPPTTRAAIVSRNIMNQQEHVAKTEGSLDVVLLVMANKLASLQRTQDPAQIAYLYREIYQIYGRFPGFTTSKPTEWLLGQAFRTAKEELHEELLTQIQVATGGATEKERSVFVGDLAPRIERYLRSNGFPHAKVSPRSKDTHAVDRKLRINPHKYAEVADIQDLLGFAIVLNEYIPAKKRKSIPLTDEEKLRVAVDPILSHFSEFLVGDQTEFKQLGDYKAFHITPYGRVGR